METISQRVKARRCELNLTQSQLAELVGIKQQSIQAIESGSTKRPRFIFELSKSLKCSAAWLQQGKK